MKTSNKASASVAGSKDIPALLKALYMELLDRGSPAEDLRLSQTCWGNTSWETEKDISMFFRRLSASKASPARKKRIRTAAIKVIPMKLLPPHLSCEKV